jgi:hypothetical protein
VENAIVATSVPQLALAQELHESLAQLLRQNRGMAGTVAGLARRASDFGGRSVNLPCTLAHPVHETEGLSRRRDETGIGCELRLDRFTDGSDQRPDLADTLADLADCVDETRRVRLQGLDPASNLFRRVPRLDRERLHLGRDDGETSARLSGPRRLDRCIEGEEVGLTGDGADEPYDRSDLGGRCPEAVSIRPCRLGCGRCLVDDGIRALGLHADVLARRREGRRRLLQSLGVTDRALRQRRETTGAGAYVADRGSGFGDAAVRRGDGVEHVRDHSGQISLEEIDIDARGMRPW